MLNVTVGTQSISPLMWSIESGAIEASGAILKDLLTIRADRDRYYYGADELFARHPDIIARLCEAAPTLLPGVMDGLMWRSRLAEGARRRVNYYVKHLLVDEQGHFNKALGWISDLKDPKIVCHPLVVILSDLLWNGPVYLTFLAGKSWLLTTLSLFLMSQSIFRNFWAYPDPTGEATRVLTFTFRLFVYAFVMGQLLVSHAIKSIKAYKTGTTVSFRCLKVPEYLVNFQELISLLQAISLAAMVCTCPVLYCWPYAHTGDYPGEGDATGICPQEIPIRTAYGVISMVVMMLYFLRLIDLTVFSNKVSAYVLMQGHVLPEVGLFTMALAFCILMFSAAVNALNEANQEFSNIAIASLSFLEITLHMFDPTYFWQVHSSGWIYFLILSFSYSIFIFLINLLIAQISSSHMEIHSEMIGYARLRRIDIICYTIPYVSMKRWHSWVETLKHEECLEFNQGDVGLAGGVQILEASNLNPTTVDAIKRFGGSTSPAMQWPEDAEEAGGENDRLGKVEKLLTRALRKMDAGKKGTGASSGAGSSGMKNSSVEGGSSSNSQGAGDDKSE